MTRRDHDQNTEYTVSMKYYSLLAPLVILPLRFNPCVAQEVGTFLLKEGTEVQLRFTEELSSKTAKIDDPVTLALDEDIKIGDITVARAGSKATAAVSAARKSGMMGRAGELAIRIDSLKVGTTKIALRGTKNREGEGKVGTAVVLTVLFGPLGLIKHGKNVELKAGTPLIAYVADDISLPPAK
jgi:hypothetical protein